MLLVRTVAASARRDFAQDLTLGPKSGDLLSIDLRSGGQAQPLINEPGETYALGPFSPDSRRVLIYWIKDRKIGLGAYDFVTRRFVRFSEGPEYHERTDFMPVWLSNEDILYPARVGGEQPFDLFGRAEAARKLSHLWERSWAGRNPSVVASESRADGGGRQPRPGSLVRANVRTGRSVVVSVGLFSDLRLSPDGRYVAALRQHTGGQPPATLNLDWTSDRRLQLVIFDRSTNASIFSSTGFTVGLGSLEWAPRGDRLAFFAWDPAKTSQFGLYHVYDARERRVSAWPHTGLDLASERERGWFPRPERAVWLGDGIAVAARALSNAEAPPTFTHRDHLRFGPAPGVGWHLLRPGAAAMPLTQGLTSVSPIAAAAAGDSLFIIGDSRLWRLSSDGRRAAALDGNYDDLSLAFPPTVRLGDARKSVALIGTRVGSTSYLLPDLRGSGAPVVVKAAPAETLLAMAPAGTALVAEDAKNSTRILLRNEVRDQAVLQLNRHLEQVRLAERRPISYRGAKGEALSGCVILPIGYVQGRRYPTIVNIYPGVRGQCSPPSVNIGSVEDLLAARGFVVLWLGNPPESIRRPEGPIAGMAATIGKGIEASVAAGYVDPNRIGLWGTSQGGFSSLWLATQMKQFKAIVSSQGWSDLPGHYLGADYRHLLFPENVPYASSTVRYDPPAGGEFTIGKTLWEAPDIYVKNSPTMHANKVTAPIMMIHSDMDIFPLWQYQAMYSGLYRLRKPACLLVYMGEGHWPESPANQKDLWTRVFAWFDQHLRDGQSNGCAEAGG
jgi:dipeptidyl aminopeptidase/acylaminoacyl peptidase